MGVGAFREQVPPSVLRGGYDTLQFTVAMNPSPVVQVIPADPNRVTLILQNISVNDISLRPERLELSEPSLKLRVASRWEVLNFSDWGPMVGAAWFAHSLGGPSRVHVISVSWRGLTR